MTSKTIVFIHGLFVNPKSWIHWKTYFEERDYICHTPANPYHEGEPSVLREHFDPALGELTFEEEVENIANLVKTLPEKPILIGHSLGGLVVQKLLSLGMGAAGVCIDGVPPKGIFTTKWSFWESNFPVLNFFKGNTVFEPNKDWFHYAFAHLMPRSESDKVFDELVVPESRNVPRGTLGKYAEVDFEAPHQPLLFIAGEKDHIVPAPLNLENFHAYKDRGSKKLYIEFPGRTHYICGMPGWQEVAGQVYYWLKEL
ncbi:MAG TPA: alpha/beta hydrolase [Dinghuibacter sp.]|jgi:pimeloyl-ACP methyl ester carboxylesterase|uniref:alpha/beta hydrolase n=1 Tax=Dinghuibacter sp. TaxID=2024697 RepID=UPI002B8F70A8|nr:alpha/beta hydrolase [Dinghuibacter sp.]HTJ13677.1 alpha/beta hydrolase [Dinghuibacter sp.]